MFLSADGVGTDCCRVSMGHVLLAIDNNDLETLKLLLDHAPDHRLDAVESAAIMSSFEMIKGMIEDRIVTVRDAELCSGRVLCDAILCADSDFYRNYHLIHAMLSYDFGPLMDVRHGAIQAARTPGDRMLLRAVWSRMKDDEYNIK